MRWLLLLALLVTAGVAREKTIHHPGTGLSFPPTIPAGKAWTRVMVEEIQDPNDPQDPHKVIGYSTPEAKLTLYLFSARGATDVKSPLFRAYWDDAKGAIALNPLGRTRLKSEGPFKIPRGPSQGLRAVYMLSGLLGGTPERSELVMLIWRGYLVKVRVTGGDANDTIAFLTALQWSKAKAPAKSPPR